MEDPHDLRRFVEAQRDTYEAALAELRHGRKVGHWMWFIFPQVAGLGASAMAQRYAIASLDEARGYLRHPVLGPRLRTCVEAMNQVAGRSAREILGSPDDLKFGSSMTLFAQAEPAEPVFRAALQRYFEGKPDMRTLEILAHLPSSS